MAPILIDTNLLVYLYDVQSPSKSEQARRVLEHLELTHSGRVSVQSLSEFIQVTTRKLAPPLTPDEALAQVNLFIGTWPVFDLTPLVVLEAARGFRDHSLAYYDAQIWAIARLNQIMLIFSEDFSDGQVLEGVRFVNPFADGFRLEEWI